MQISSKLFNQQQLKQFSSTTEELQELQCKLFELASPSFIGKFAEFIT